MNKLRFYITFLLSAMLLYSKAQITPISQMEKLDRGLVALPANSGSGNFVSWRFLGTDDNNARFDLLRNGTTIASDLEVTNYKDASGNSSSEYQVITKVNGEVISTSDPVKAWGDVYKKLKLDRPAKGALGGTYSPNDCSVGDVDGDGEYELFVKWDPNNSKDNSQSDKTDNVYIDCYKFDGTKLWRIDLGVNIRAGAHYTQFQVFDYDGDGKAEMMCKTAPGTKDGLGSYVNQAATNDKIKAADNTKDWRTSAGRINGGHEYLTVFNGETGAAIHTIAYYPNRNAKPELSEAAGSYNWDDRSGKNDKGDYGNRGERYLAATAYLDGPDHNPSGIFCRGYYTFAHSWAVDFDGQQLKTRWLHSSDSRTTYKLRDAEGNQKTLKGSICTSGLKRYTMYANGNHNMSIADVDGDGKDEIIWGSAALDDDGKMLYATGFGHGDAIHLGDFNPDRPGLEVFEVHEEKGTYAWDLHDAATGEILFKGGPEGVDNGRGMCAQLDPKHRGAYFSSASERQQRSATTGEIASSVQASVNFRIYWDGDLQEELLDGTKIDKWTASGTTRLYIKGKNPYDYNASSSCNSTKATPNLQADIFGDWREEIILWSTNDNATLNIFTTNTPTTYRVPTLMHDHTYRMGICWQNTAYNQPPHLGYYLPDYIDGKLTGIETIKTNMQTEKAILYDLSGRRLPTSDFNSLPKGIYIIKQGTNIIKYNKK
jgi:rhamnogalacturonan endolyase